MQKVLVVVDAVVVVVVVVTLSRSQVRGHRTGSSYSGVEEYPMEKIIKPKVVHVYIMPEASHASAEK